MTHRPTSMPLKRQQFMELVLIIAAAVLLGAVVPGPMCAVVAALDESATAKLRRNSAPAASSGSAFLVQDNLGVLPSTSVAAMGSDPERVKFAGASTLTMILQQHYGFSGAESFVPADQPIRFDDPRATAHIRYKQLVGGLPLEGASVAIHVRSKTGTVYAVNGELHNQASIDAANEDAGTGTLACEAVLDLALVEFGQRDPGILASGNWQGDCQAAAVQGSDGKPYMAYKRLYGYQPSQSATWGTVTAPEQRDMIYAQRTTGRLVAVHPTILSERAMDTRNCGSLEVDVPDECVSFTTSPDKIITGDEHIDNVHNFTVDVYEMYARQFGFKSMDGRDMVIRSLAHYGKDMNNAFFDFSGYLAYGDGDGSYYKQFTQMDVSELNSPRSLMGCFDLAVRIDRHSRFSTFVL
jgi:Thermolysin metallopeptidase, catalytic domain/Fungalysin/Thermolysin Propeptide Motif